MSLPKAAGSASRAAFPLAKTLSLLAINAGLNSRPHYILCLYVIQASLVHV